MKLLWYRCVFNKNSKEPFLNTFILFQALLAGKLRGEVFDPDIAFSARNVIRFTVISERANNNVYHLPACYIVFVFALSYAKRERRGSDESIIQMCNTQKNYCKIVYRRL